MMTVNQAVITVGEQGGVMTITVNLSHPSAQVVTVNYATSDGTAAAGSDYTPASGALIFQPGQTSQRFSVAVMENVLGDTDKTVNLTLSNPANATLGAQNTAVLLIENTRQQLLLFLPFMALNR
jgi:hypothetical protein